MYTDLLTTFSFNKFRFFLSFRLKKTGSIILQAMTEPCRRVQVVSKINKCIELSMPSVFDIVITIETIKSLNYTFIE